MVTFHHCQPLATIHYSCFNYLKIFTTEELNFGWRCSFTVIHGHYIAIFRVFHPWSNLPSVLNQLRSDKTLYPNVLLANVTKRISHLVRAQNVPKNYHFLSRDTHTYACASGGKKC